jgi:hypothetical protein
MRAQRYKLTFTPVVRITFLFVCAIDIHLLLGGWHKVTVNAFSEEVHMI